MNVTGDGSKVQCCKEQYYIGTWNVRSMNQGKLKVIKQEVARVNNNKMVPISSSSESPNFKREKKMREIEMHSNAVFHRNLEH